MAVGVSGTLANRWLDYSRGAGAPTAITTVYVQLHTANPGAAGTTSVSSVTTRPAVTYGAAASGVITQSNTPSWATWAGADGEVVSHVSIWDASSAGNFLFSIALSASKTVNTGDTLNLTTSTVTITTAS